MSRGALAEAEVLADRDAGGPELAEIAELRRRLSSLPVESQARILEGVLTPGLRLRVLAEQVRHQVGDLTDEQEAIAEQEINDAVRDVRLSLVRGR